MIVHTDEAAGIASGGDGLPDRAAIERFLVGRSRCARRPCAKVRQTIDLHGGRPAEIAVWDIVGKATGQPLWKLLGGRSERLLAYASTGELVAPEERADRCRRSSRRA